ncbi:MAG: DVUA0089 family protein, partial [Bacteroidota bacterium]
EPINGTSCFTCDGDESCLVGAGAKAMFNRPYTDLPSISFIGWEDDNDPRCSFNNDDEWHQSFYDVPPPSVRQPAKWATGFGVNGSNWVQAWMMPFSANWDMRVSTTWRYESGQSFNDPLDFGPVDPNPAGYHYDRNSSANPDGLVLDWAYGNTIGDVAPDVIYKFRLTGDGRVRISTDNGTTDDEFDTRLYLYDEDLNEIAENDDTPEGPAGNRKSTIIKNLCAGTYFIRVSGYNGDSGQFGLRVIYEEGLPEFVLGVNQTDVSCPGGSDGQIAFATVGGLGEGPISYTIGGLNESDIVSNPATGLSAGTYTVWAIDQCFNTAGGFEVPIQDGDDNTLPVANCKDITLLLHDSQSSWDFPFPDYLTFITDSYDNCGDFTPTFDPPVIYGSDEPEVTYTMTLTDESGNSSSCTGIITVDLNIPSSVQQDEALDAALQTFPNPASDWLNIQIKNHPINRGFIYLRDQTGRLLHQVNLERSQADWSGRIDMSQLPPAVYTLQLITADGQLTRPIIKQ